MKEIFYCWIFFCFWILGHRTIYKTFGREFGFISSILYFLAGSLLVLLFLSFTNTYLFWTPFVIFTQLSGVYLIFLTGIYLNDSSPSSFIINLLKQKPSQTERQIISAFSNQNLVKKRLDELVIGKYVSYSKLDYRLTKKGQFMAGFLNLLSKYLGWHYQ